MHSGAVIGGLEAGRSGDTASPAQGSVHAAHTHRAATSARSLQARSTIRVFFFPVRTTQYRP